MRASSTFSTSGTVSIVSPIYRNTAENGITGITKESKRNLQIALPQRSSSENAKLDQYGVGG
jgi:hypothetical protein